MGPLMESQTQFVGNVQSKPRVPSNNPCLHEGTCLFPPRPPSAHTRLLTGISIHTQAVQSEFLILSIGAFLGYPFGTVKFRMA